MPSIGNLVNLRLGLALLVFFTNLLYMPALVAESAKEKSAAQLFKLINARLAYMEDIALYKAQHELPIEDLEREIIVLNSAAESAEDEGIDIHSARLFFARQIDIAKSIQRQVLADFSYQQVAMSQPKDLNEEIRPALTSLGNELLASLHSYLQKFGPITEMEKNLFFEQVDNRYLNRKMRLSLFYSLRQVRLKSH